MLAQSSRTWLCISRAAPALRGIFVAGVEKVLTDVADCSEPEVIAGVVEDQKFVLALGGAQAPADRLDKKDPALGGVGVDDAARRR